MKKEDIIRIFKNLGIEVTKINSASNSFNSNVYIIESDNCKYVFKINTRKSKTEVENRYMSYLHKYLTTPEVISTGYLNGNSYIIMTFLEGDNKFDEEANSLSSEQLNNIGVLLGTMHDLPLIDEENDLWIKYLDDALEKTQGVLKEVFGKDNEKIYTYLKKYINNNIKRNYRNSILHMDFRLGNLIIKNNDIGLIDMESMKNGEYVFDFVKLYRILSEDNFKKLLSGYKKVREIDENFLNKLDFYTLYDSYTSLWWSITRNKTDSEFYKMNYDVVKRHLDILNNR